MRIVSLLPSATDIVASLGLVESLVGRTHECDWPPEVREVPVMTRDELGTLTMGTREIHEAIKASVHTGSSIYSLEVEALNAAAPDLILTQELCEVCAVSYSKVAEAARLLEADVKVLSLEPRGIGDILDHIRLVAEMAGVPRRGERTVHELAERLDAVSERLRDKPRPTVASLEWLDPLFCGGHWVPEQVEAAGGHEVLGTAGKYSREVEWEAVMGGRPEYLVLMPCGHPIDRTEKDLSLLSERPAWSEVPAVKQDHVWSVDGPACFNRPGPRVVRGVEVLAGIFHGVCEFTSDEARQMNLSETRTHRG